MPNSRREEQRNRTRCLRGNSPPSRAPQGPAQAAGLAPRLNPAHRTRPLSEQRQPRPSLVKHSAQIELQSLTSGRESQRMSTAETSTSELAKNWPSTLGQFTEVWWAQQDLNLRPSDYESPALTAELWARSTGILNTLRLPCPLTRRSRRRTIAASVLFVHTAWPTRLPASPIADNNRPLLSDLSRRGAWRLPAPVHRAWRGVPKTAFVPARCGPNETDAPAGHRLTRLLWPSSSRGFRGTNRPACPNRRRCHRATRARWPAAPPCCKTPRRGATPSGRLPATKSGRPCPGPPAGRRRRWKCIRQISRSSARSRCGSPQ